MNHVTYYSNCITLTVQTKWSLHCSYKNQLQFKNEKNAPSPRSGHVSLLLKDKMVIFGGYCKQLLTDHIFLVNINPITINPDNKNNLNVKQYVIFYYRFFFPQFVF